MRFRTSPMNAARSASGGRDRDRQLRQARVQRTGRAALPRSSHGGRILPPVGSRYADADAQSEKLLLATSPSPALTARHFMFWVPAPRKTCIVAGLSRIFPVEGVAYRNATDALHDRDRWSALARTPCSALLIRCIGNGVPFPFLPKDDCRWRGPALVGRLSFTGELGYEIYAPQFQRSSFNDRAPR